MCQTQSYIGVVDDDELILKKTENREHNWDIYYYSTSNVVHDLR